MYHLATVFPFLKNIRIPVTRDQMMLLLVVANQYFLGVDHYIAHIISGTLTFWERFPILYGLGAGTLLLITGLISLKYRRTAAIYSTIILVFSMIVGALGWVLHLIRIAAPFAPIGERFTMNIIIWSPPILAPLTACMIGLVGIGSAWCEAPVDSGKYVFNNKFKIQIPISKTRGWFLLVGLGILATLISSVLDHARTGWENPWLWFPVAGGVFGVVSCLLMGGTEKPSRGDLIVHTCAMCLLVVIGVTGTILHLQEVVTSQGVFIWERMVRGAPFLAPMLYADMAAFGLLLMMDPDERC